MGFNTHGDSIYLDYRPYEVKYTMIQAAGRSGVNQIEMGFFADSLYCGFMLFYRNKVDTHSNETSNQ